MWPGASRWHYKLDSALSFFFRSGVRCKWKPVRRPYAIVFESFRFQTCESLLGRALSEFLRPSQVAIDGTQSSIWTAYGGLILIQIIPLNLDGLCRTLSGTLGSNPEATFGPGLLSPAEMVMGTKVPLSMLPLKWQCKGADSEPDATLNIEFYSTGRENFLLCPFAFICLFSKPMLLRAAHCILHTACCMLHVASCLCWLPRLFYL